MKINIIKLTDDAIIPSYQTEGAAGFDLHILEDYSLAPGEKRVFGTGLSFEIPVGYELQIIPRSGISLKTNLKISNSPGCVDSDYRGEVGIIVEHIISSLNVQEPIALQKGMRIAQGKIVPVVRAEFNLVDSLTPTNRGAGAYGSSGV